MIFNESQNIHESFSDLELSRSSLSQEVLPKIIPLLEERLMVEIARQKKGEIVVRKEVETNIFTLNIPIRREKIIVEQINPSYVKIAEVNLSDNNLLEQEIQGKYDSEVLKIISIDNEAILESSLSSERIIGDFDSLKDAHDFLSSVLSGFSIFDGSIHIEIVLENT